MFKNNKDKKEVLAAVKDGGYLLKYADKSLLKDIEIVEEFIAILNKLS